MKTLSYTLRFNSPAFLGNADQSAQWRTPPIKAQLRQWWRVAVAQELDYRVDTLRQREAALFGVAADGADSHQSLLRLRLSHWDDGKLKSWQSTGTVKHPEVPAAVGSDLYLGYGPLTFVKGAGTAIKNNAAINAGESAALRVAVPAEHAAHIQTALWLMDRFGTLGGRSRNGWGSFSLQPAHENTAALAGNLPTQPWQAALGRDWPHAIGTDDQGALLWQTAPFADWKQLMQELARLKIGLRTQFGFTTGKGNPAINPENRHWLSYPVTNHSVRTWDRNARLPNSLRFKVRPAPSDPKKVVGVILHMPCLPPPAFYPKLQAIEGVWQAVHGFLDKQQTLTRTPT